jgi:hypothetical protein
VSTLGQVRVCEEEERDGCWNEALMCFVRHLEYDFITRTGILHMNKYSCTDMTGCIALFVRTDPEVRHILTVEQGGTVTSRYERDDDEKWYSVRLPRDARISDLMMTRAGAV